MSNKEESDGQPAKVFISSQQHPVPGDDDAMELNLVDCYYMVRNRPLVFLVFPVVFCILAIIYVLVVTPQYKATSQLLIDQSNAKITGIKDVYDPMDGGGNFDKFTKTQLSLIKSREMMTKVYEHFNLAADPNYTGAEDPIRSLSKCVTVSAVKGTYLVDVSVQYPDPKQAAEIANYISDLYVETYRSSKMGISGSGLGKLRDQLSEMHKARDQARKQMIAFKEKHSLINLDDAEKLLVERMSTINGALVEAQVQEAKLKALLLAADDLKKKTKNFNLSILPESIRTEAVNSLYLEKLQAEAKLNSLLTSYDKNHRVIKNQQNSVDVLEQAVTKEIMNALDGARTKYDRAQKNTLVLKEEINELNRQSLLVDRLSGDYQILEDAYAAAQDSYRLLIKRINEVSIAQSANDLEGASSVKVVARALPSKDKVSPKKKKIVVMAGFSGVILGAGLCLLLGLLDTSVKSKEDVEGILGHLPVLGSIPALTAGETPLQAIKDQGCSLAEAFRNTQVSLSLSLIGRDEQVFAVSSSQEGEGKTTTAFNLALALARNSKRVLLIEGDMRQPALGARLADLNPQQDQGLSNILIGDSQLSDVAWSVPDVSGLDIIFSGPIPPNPAELLGASHLKALLDEAKASYDVVIIDSPSVLNVADASIITGLGIPLICVVRLFSTGRHQLTALREQMETIQGRVAGLVLNHADTPKRLF